MRLITGILAILFGGTMIFVMVYMLGEIGDVSGDMLELMALSLAYIYTAFYALLVVLGLLTIIKKNSKGLLLALGILLLISVFIELGGGMILFRLATLTEYLPGQFGAEVYAGINAGIFALQILMIITTSVALAKKRD